jgi:hypothetical protein
MALAVAQLIKDAIQKGLYERAGIFNLLPDYSFKIQGQWADSVDFPRNPQVFVGKAPVTTASGNRTLIKGGMDKVNAAFVTYYCALSEESEARYMSDGEMANSVVSDAVDALGDQLDADVCAELASGIPAGQIIPVIGGSVVWKDLITGSAKARVLKVGASSLLYLIPPALEPEVKDIDVIKMALAYNQNYFENGVAKVDNNYYTFTSMVPQINGKDVILIANLRFCGRATKKWMDRREAYDKETGYQNIDYLSYVAIKKCRTQAVIALTK